MDFIAGGQPDDAIPASVISLHFLDDEEFRLPCEARPRPGSCLSSPFLTYCTSTKP